MKRRKQSAQVLLDKPIFIIRETKADEGPPPRPYTNFHDLVQYASDVERPLGAQDDVRKLFLAFGIGAGAEGRLASWRLLNEQPAWLELKPELAYIVKQRFLDIITNYPVNNLKDFIWCLALDGVKPKGKGRKRKWAGAHGVIFVEQVTQTLCAKNKKSCDPKALRRAIATVRETYRSLYHRYSEARLRDAYYEALPTYRAFVSALREKDDN